MGLLVACPAPGPEPGLSAPALDLRPAAMAISDLPAPAQPCTGAFHPTDLDHFTAVPGDSVDMFEANGSGVALNDLDNDGDLDIVLGNHAGENTILWNEGGLNFRSERLPFGHTRAVNIVDLDADGRLDLVFTRRTGAVNFLRNLGDGQFRQQTLPGIARPAYAMNWGDLDGDGDLDLVTGSYDAGLLADLGNDFLLGRGGGVFFYENSGQGFAARQLAGAAQTMAIVFFDTNGDGRRDIVAGNDFAVPDGVWERNEEGWVQSLPFSTTSHSTMSLDIADVNNDGQFELFSTDMMPIDDDPATIAAWQPLIDDMMADPHAVEDPQIMANVLQLHTGASGYQDSARPRGIAASGWSWSAKFGDLDQDGWLDLYVVNGFAESTIFAHLPDHELVEANQALRNRGNGYFRAEPGWGLGSERGGRGMSMGDVDGDGDLDIVINNLRGPAQLFENRLCGGASLQVDLHWPGSGNTRALGSTLILHTSFGTLSREVRAASGYLSGDPARVHFGFPADARLDALEIRWPDGATSRVGDLRAQSLVSATR